MNATAKHPVKDGYGQVTLFGEPVQQQDGNVFTDDFGFRWCRASRNAKHTCIFPLTTMINGKVTSQWVMKVADWQEIRETIRNKIRAKSTCTS